jgi:hypothetical protein
MARSATFMYTVQILAEKGFSEHNQAVWAERKRVSAFRSLQWVLHFPRHQQYLQRSHKPA